MPCFVGFDWRTLLYSTAAWFFQRSLALREDNWEVLPRIKKFCHLPKKVLSAVKKNKKTNPVIILPSAVYRVLREVKLTWDLVNKDLTALHKQADAFFKKRFKKKIVNASKFQSLLSLTLPPPSLPGQSLHIEFSI